MIEIYEYQITLQWGRNFFVTEIWKRKFPYGDRLPLQWGRNFFVTEMSILLLHRLNIQGFNGAVTFSLRKFLMSASNSWNSSVSFNGAVTFSLRK